MPEKKKPPPEDVSPSRADVLKHHAEAQNRQKEKEEREAKEKADKEI